jgi:hypothetical protein
VNADAREHARQHALWYRGMGFQPLPSREDRKGPALDSYAEYWDERLPADVYDRTQWRTANVQLMTGARWGLAVVDCDGADAERVWAEMCAHFGDPGPTWQVRTGGGGLHTYFALPRWLDACPSRRLWGVWDTWAGPKHQGDWRKHQEVRLLADHALVIAVPSRHVATGRPYEWVPGRGPDVGLVRAPAWLLDRPALVNPQCVEAMPPDPRIAMPVRGPRTAQGPSYGRHEVLAAIPDKAALAAAWGLRLASRTPNRAGWLPCHALDRDDEVPSATFHAATGVYFEHREGVKLSLLDLGVALGRYGSWLDALADLGDRFLGRAPAPAPASGTSSGS